MRKDGSLPAARLSLPAQHPAAEAHNPDFSNCLHPRLFRLSLRGVTTRVRVLGVISSGGWDAGCIRGRFFRVGCRIVAFKIFFPLLYTRPLSDPAKLDLFLYIFSMLVELAVLVSGPDNWLINA